MKIKEFRPRGGHTFRDGSMNPWPHIRCDTDFRDEVMQSVT